MKNGVMQFPENHLLTWVNGTGSDVASGDPVLVNDLFWGIANADIADGASGTLHRGGAFELPKASAETFDQGELLFFEAGELTAVDNNTPPIGSCRKAAGAGVTVAVVDINFPMLPATSAG